MKNSITILSVLLFLSLFTWSCASDDDDETTDPTPPVITNPYENCCGTLPLTGEVGGSSFYVPNIFTPNGDGINDLFLVLAGSDIQMINSMVISNQSDSIVFEQVNIMPNSTDGSWSGKDAQGNTLGGLFDVELEITSSTGQSMEFTTQVCSYPCGVTGFPTDNLSDCGFPSQHDGQGDVDFSLPTNDSNCF